VLIGLQQQQQHSNNENYGEPGNSIQGIKQAGFSESETAIARWRMHNMKAYSAKSSDEAYHCNLEICVKGIWQKNLLNLNSRLSFFSVSLKSS